MVKPRLHRPIGKYALQWLMLGLALAIFGGFTVLTMIQERDALDRQQRERLLGQVRVINANMGRQLEAVNLALERIQKEFPRRSDDPGWLQTARLLDAMCDAMPGIRTLAILDANGLIMTSNRPELLGMNVSHREYFQAPRRNPDPSILYVSPPFRSTLGAYTLNITRAMTDGQGTFRGTVTAALDPEYFKVLLTSVLYAPDVRSGITHSSGLAFLTVPPATGERQGEPLTGSDLVARHLEGSQFESIMTSPPDASGPERLTALRTVRLAGRPLDNPLVVSVSRDREAIFTVWRRTVLTEGALLALIGLISAWSLLVYQRRMKRFDAKAQEAADAVLESEERYRSLFLNNHSVMLLIDPETAEIVDANPAACLYYGWNRDELTRKSIGEINTLSPEEIRQELERARSMQRNHFFFRHRRADGEIRDVEVYSGPVRLHQKDYLYSMVHDVTDRKRMEAEILRTQKLESLGILAGGIAHDFNNLMMRLLGYLDLVRLDLPPESRSRRRLEAAIEGVVQTRELTARLLTFSQSETPVSGECDLAELARDAVERMVTGTDVRVEFDVAAGLVPIRVDANQMKQCFYNLAKNAVEAMPEGGVLRVGMATVRIGAEETLPLREGDHLRITFSDSGVGISRENLPKVFDPYFTTKQMGAVKGTGLGLAVCYSVVKQHGGHIELLSEPGQGTEVRIYLPVLRTPAAGTEFSPGVDDRDGKDA